jgi:hypothetical protein
MNGSAWLIALWMLTTFSGVALAGTAPVPEPSSLALMAAGIAGAALFKFRRRK